MAVFLVFPSTSSYTSNLKPDCCKQQKPYSLFAAGPYRPSPPSLPPSHCPDDQLDHITHHPSPAETDDGQSVVTGKHEKMHPSSLWGVVCTESYYEMTPPPQHTQTVGYGETTLKQRGVFLARRKEGRKDSGERETRGSARDESVLVKRLSKKASVWQEGGGG